MSLTGQGTWDTGSAWYLFFCCLTTSSSDAHWKKEGKPRRRKCEKLPVKLESPSVPKKEMFIACLPGARHSTLAVPVSPHQRLPDFQPGSFITFYK